MAAAGRHERENGEQEDGTQAQAGTLDYFNDSQISGDIRDCRMVHPVAGVQSARPRAN
jgi:hypothetical protein